MNPRCGGYGGWWAKGDDRIQYADSINHHFHYDHHVLENCDYITCPDCLGRGRVGIDYGKKG